MKPSRLVLGLLVLSLVVVGLAVAFPVTVPDEYEPSASSTNGTVDVTGGEIDADQTELWNWTQRAMDRNATVTPKVVLRDVDDSIAGSAPATEATEFQRLLVYDDPEQQPSGGILAYVTPFSTDVTVDEDRLSAVQNGTTGRTVDGVLVHEFAHVLQFQTPAFREHYHLGLSAPSDETRAYQAIVEGGAEFVANEYTADSAIDRIRRFWNDPDTSAAERLGQWPYYRGLVSLDGHLDDSADLWNVYENRPTTAATVLRGDPVGDGPPNRSLSIDIADYHTEVEDRPGAAIAEVALTKEIDPGRARDVAAGWRWGALRSIQPDQGTATDRSLRHVWVTEWQNESAADEFETAMSEYLDGRWAGEGDTWNASDGPSFALERVDGDSLALLVGPDSFLANASVRIEGDEYSIGTSESPSASMSASRAASASGGPPASASGSAPASSPDTIARSPTPRAGA